ncbi:MAG: VTT domain-containing protein [Reichenbachiella sp.]|uniref:TVP38/TMEM64 family protein n=1 Tax=Reichenbachiella sp. TaxID=2184521 RepID=UPI00326385EF
MNNYKISFFLNRQNAIFFLMSWMTFLPWVSTAGVSVLAMTHEAWINGFSEGEWALFFLLSVFTMGLAITPTTFISLLCGYFLSWHAVIPVILCYQLASLIGYYLARPVDQQAVDWIKQKYPKSNMVFQNVEKEQWLTTLLARISPVLPFGLMNVVLSVAEVRIVPFLFGGLLGMLPRTLFFIWLGTQAPVLMKALQTGDQFIWLVLLSLIGIFGLYRVLFAKR